MKLHIAHRTTYTYSAPVFLEQHQLRLLPMLTPNQRLLSYDLTVLPEPQGMAHLRDAEDTPYTQVWFADLHSRKEICLEMTVDSLPFNPFSFLPDELPGAPGKWQVPQAPQVLLPYVAQSPLGPELEDLAIELQSTTTDALTYLGQLCTLLAERHGHIARTEAELWTPERTWSEKQGSCRDLAVLAMALLRRWGIPSRYVSGYAFDDDDELTGHELHAWIEAFLPGGGWVGADPTAGVLCTERYVAVAASLDPVATLPVIGSYRGDATAELQTEVVISLG